MFFSTGDLHSSLCDKLEILRSNPNAPLYFQLENTSCALGTHEQKGNHFILFLKPESFEVGSNSQGILKTLDDALSKFNIQLGRISLLSGSYLKKHKIIDRHYGVLNKISRRGFSACSSASIRKAEEIFGVLAHEKILGGHQFLEKYEGFSPYSLCTLNDNLGTKKLGAGTYGIKIRNFDEEVVVLNGFHPYQLEALTKTGTGILAIECFSSKPWSVLRWDMIGGIRPDAANLGSFRRSLFEERAALKLKKINVAFNYIHISPGPIEAMMQICRFFSNYETGDIVRWRDTQLGTLLPNLNDKAILRLEENPEINFNGELVPVFDKTEDLDTSDSLEIIKASLCSFNLISD